MKTILVTGGGRGLGRGAAKALAEQGHRVVLTARDPAAGARVVEAIRRASPAANVEHRKLELDSFAASTGLFWAEKNRFESSPQSRDVEDARRFWAWAEEVTKTGAWST